MLWMYPGNSSIIFDTEVDVPAIGIGEANHSLDQLAVWQALHVAFEFIRERRTLRKRPHHFSLTYPFSRSCLPIDDHSNLPARSCCQAVFASFQGTTSRKGAMLSRTPSLRSGVR